MIVPRCRFVAFTLLELLVVIAVLAVLSSILLVTMGAVRDRANAAKDSSNLRQIYATIRLYANDHNQLLPVVDGRLVRSSDRWRWYGVEHVPGRADTDRSPLMDYAGVDSVRAFNDLTIPVANKREVPQAETRGAAEQGAYGFPYLVNYNLMRGGFNPDGTAQRPASLNQVTEPGSTVMMAPSVTEVWGPGFHAGGGFNRIHANRNGETLILWADGHASFFPKADLLAEPAHYINLD